MNWQIYLSGEVHSDWRQAIIELAMAKSLPVNFVSAVTDHAASDAAGDLLGEEGDAYWRDHKSAKVNAIRIRTLLDQCDVAVIRFSGKKFKEWNTAFDAGYCAASGTPYITLHSAADNHALKEVDGQAMAWAQTAEQVVAILEYVTNQKIA